jgi:hypothetical protein
MLTQKRTSGKQKSKYIATAQFLGISWSNPGGMTCNKQTSLPLQLPASRPGVKAEAAFTTLHICLILAGSIIYSWGYLVYRRTKESKV